MATRGRNIFSKEGNTLFITNTVMNFDKVFSLGEQYYMILLDSLNYVLTEHHAILYAYVFMPSHIHFIVNMPEGESISDLMRDFKKYTSTKIRQQLEKDDHTSWVERLRSHAKGKKQVFKLWMDRFDDVVLFSRRMMTVKIDYIHDNPVKAGLVENPEDWKFSSARNYILNDHSLIYVETEW